MIIKPKNVRYPDGKGETAGTPVSHYCKAYRCPKSSNFKTHSASQTRSFADIVAIMSVPSSEIIKCTSCGTRNRASFSGAKQPVCGRCRSPLAKPSGPVVLTDATFEKLLDETAQPILIDMWAAWCGPCRIIAPIIDSLATEFSGRAVIAKLDVDANPQTASRFSVRSIPT